MKKPRFRSGDKALFHYECFKSDESCDAKLWHHTNQLVTVVKKLSDIDEGDVGYMYKVKFKDGLQYDVFEHELRKKRK